MDKLTKLLAALGLSLCVVSAFAEPKALTEASEMHGCWERINFSPEFSKQVNPTEYWAQPYQWFCFETDGKTTSMMSSEYS